MRILTWTKETVSVIAKQFTSAEKFKTRHPSAYKYAVAEGLLDELYPAKVFKRKTKWTTEQLKKEAKKYKTRSDFVKGSPAAYHAAYIRMILDKICGHMIEKRHDWTKKEIRREAKKYNTRSKFSKNSPKAYRAALVTGILDEVCAHMVSGYELRRPTTEEITKEAKKYQTRTGFLRGSGKYYRLAVKMKVLNEVCSHMTSLKQPWKTEDLKLIALKYKTKKQFREAETGAYQAAYSRKIINEICSHMTRPNHMAREEKIAMVKDEASKYKSRKSFRLASPTLYQKASSLEILNEVCSHMTK